VLDEGEERLAREILGHIADKWPIRVICTLGTSGRLRFSRLLERVEGVSQKMLTKTLRRLERDELVTRTIYLEVPPRVEYEPSPTGRELLLRVCPLWTWICSANPRGRDFASQSCEETRGAWGKAFSGPSGVAHFQGDFDGATGSARVPGRCSGGGRSATLRRVA
jgi:DNA-binding HxlR family transcriptional regulator